MLYGFPKRNVLRRFILLIFMITISATWIAELSADNNSITFLWAFTALTGTQHDKRVIGLTTDSVLYSGDKFKIMFEAEDRCYFYILFKGSDEKTLVLYPKKFESNRHLAIENESTFLPSKYDWFTLDEKTGKETLYVLVSPETLPEIESLLEQYYSASSESRDRVGQLIVNFIDKKESFNRPLIAKAEKPIQIGGAIRSLSSSALPENEISKFTEEITVEEFFIRTYSIEHR